MNRFELAKEAIDQCRSHACKDTCQRNSDGLCLTQIALWANQHTVVARWNDHVETATPEPGYL
jgi:hypothetical protein